MPLSIVANVNQCGVAYELHGHTPEPVLLILARVDTLEKFRDQLAETNPGMRHAVIGQLAVMLGRKLWPEMQTKLAD